MRPAWPLFPILALCLLQALPAAAQPPSAPPAASSPEETRRLKLADEAQASYRAGKLAVAAEKLRAAIAIRPTALTLWALAQAEEALGEDEGATKHRTAALALARGGDEGAEGLRESLVARAQLLLDDGKIVEAAAKLRDAVSIRKTADALRLLAVTEHRSHQYLAAKRHLDEAAALAAADRSDAEAAPIKELLAKVTPLLGKVRVVLPAGVSGARVSVDGESVSPPGGAADVEPGTHRIVVDAPGRRSFSTSIDVAAGGDAQVEADLPVVRTPLGAQRIGAIVALGGAALGLGVGIGAGSKALDLHNGLVGVCPEGHCPTSRSGAVDEYHLFARAADVAFAVAGAGATAAVVLWLTAPSEPAAAPAIVPVAGPGYVGVRGRF